MEFFCSNNSIYVRGENGKQKYICLDIILYSLKKVLTKIKCYSNILFACKTHTMREWLSGGAPPCQGGGRGFDPRLALFLVFKGILFVCRDSLCSWAFLPFLCFSYMKFIFIYKHLFLYFLISIWHGYDTNYKKLLLK